MKRLATEVTEATEILFFLPSLVSRAIFLPSVLSAHSVAKHIFLLSSVSRLIFPSSFSVPINPMHQEVPVWLRNC